MAAQDQGFANDDLQELKTHLLDLKHALRTVPSRRSQKKAKKNSKTGSASLPDTKEAIIEKVESDLKAIASSVFTKAEHLNFRLPASKASRDLYDKLKQIRGRRRTEEDLDQVHSLLTAFVRELDPEHPFLSAPKKLFLRDAGDAEDVDQRRERRLRFENFNVNDMLDSLGVTSNAGGDSVTEDDEARDPDYQDEPMGGTEVRMEDPE